MMIPRTLYDALSEGYEVVDCSLQRGYVSRKVTIKDCVIKVAGGKRKGQIYALVPSYRSTQYCRRFYLRKTL